ncbi:Cytochrome P450 87A3 [Vitis vinifera]|uniref:Cytochrome P450 87A3 n=1 Tax=Vitis vinifera TaxID=29760 RepID=A0A438HL80_VITVI|nr:Cytochrome P450 87A3 [Vitis vinifera]
MAAQKWLNPKCKGRLPRGSMGLPIIGETIPFFSPHSFYGIPHFISKRMTKYGSVLKTSLVGNLVVVSGDSELNQYIFKEGKSVYCSYKESALKIMGEQSLLAYHGVFHKYLKNLTLSMIGPESLKEVLLHETDAITRKYLHSCSNYASFDVKEESANMVFEYFAKKLFGCEEAKAYRRNLRESYKAFLDGIISFPLNIPGTAFHACLKVGCENAVKVINERKPSKKPCHDFLDFLLEEAKNEDTILNEAIIVDLFVLLFASYETTSEVITLAMKFLSDHPSIVVELMKEHERILKNRGNEELGITWTEYKSMTSTHMVINETLRLGNIVSGIFKQVTKDIEMKGKFKITLRCYLVDILE